MEALSHPKRMIWTGIWMENVQCPALAQDVVCGQHQRTARQQRSMHEYDRLHVTLLGLYSRHDLIILDIISSLLV